MPLPVGYLPNRGDTLVVLATVKFTVNPTEDADDDGLQVHLSPVGASYSSFRIPVADVYALYARHWEDGIPVRSVIDHDDCGIIIAVHESWVWVLKPGLAAPVVFHANDIEAVPEPLQAAED